ncbi:hypothetical protein BKA65DRAFT_554714 [Rhexocercosporidium sp. MPI-PUGE-AT-0058]|nr:hypothetical protein BKA65DRAFT_554714 [Rhexocercosporidium sp. MPI-PUGE-AT-0058]
MSTVTMGKDPTSLSTSLAPALVENMTPLVESISRDEMNKGTITERQTFVNSTDPGRDGENTCLVLGSPGVYNTADYAGIVSKKTINDLPIELLMMVFNILEASDQWYAYEMTCLGLASTRLYSVLKIIHPKPICWRKGNNFVDTYHESWIYKLQYDIGTFLGPNYRRRAYDNRFLPWEANDVPFLRRAVYGDSYGEEEKALNERYSDWKSCGLGDQLRPFGKGQGWFKTAFEMMYPSNEMYYRRKWDQGAPYRLHPHQLFAYQRMKFHYEEKYDSFREAADMMGL